MKASNLNLWYITVVLYAAVTADLPCAPREYGEGNIVCVCNRTYCDTIEKISPLPEGQYVLYSSTLKGERFNRSVGSFSKSPLSYGVHFRVDQSKTFQSIYGFGGAFTDSAGINIESLSLKTKENLLRSYFSDDGIDFNFGRVPIAGCDFSTHTYTYDDVPGDTNLTHFSLTSEDMEIKIPLIKEAQKLSSKNIKLLAAAWSAPPWMKTNDAFTGFSFLRDEYFQTWAKYHIKFLDEYKLHGLDFWGISTGNEPTNGLIPINLFNSMGWLPSTQSRWIEEHLGPALNMSEYRDVKLLVLDDQRFLMPWWLNRLLSNEKTTSYVDGIAVHWYWDTLFPPRLLDLTHNNFPEKFILATEACVGDKPWDLEKVILGSWPRGEMYMEDILQDLNHWVTGWIDWNLALDLQGGPNWAKNYVDSAIIVDAKVNEFYKQPMFYAIGHFSKFLPEGSTRIGLNSQRSKGITGVAFKTPENAIVIIFYNSWNSGTKVTVIDSERYINLFIPERSFNTLIYWINGTTDSSSS